jgi:hypothetical protein
MKWLSRALAIEPTTLVKASCKIDKHAEGFHN